MKSLVIIIITLLFYNTAIAQTSFCEYDISMTDSSNIEIISLSPEDFKEGKTIQIINKLKSCDCSVSSYEILLVSDRRPLQIFKIISNRFSLNMFNIDFERNIDKTYSLVVEAKLDLKTKYCRKTKTALSVPITIK